MNHIITFIRGLFVNEKTVAKTMQAFHTAIDELREIEKEAADRAWDIEQRIMNLRDEQDEHDRESSKASDLADKLEAIFK